MLFIKHKKEARNPKTDKRYINYNKGQDEYQ